MEWEFVKYELVIDTEITVEMLKVAKFSGGSAARDEIFIRCSVGGNDFRNKLRSFRRFSISRSANSNWQHEAISFGDFIIGD